MVTHQGAVGTHERRSEPVRAERSTPRPRRPVVRTVGELRVPLAGPYAPRAQLLQFPDGRLLWRLRLWEGDRPVPHVVGTETLREFARVNRLPDLRRRIDELVARAVRRERA